MVRKFVLDPVKEKKKEKKLKAGKLDPHLTLITVSLPGGKTKLIEVDKTVLWFSKTFLKIFTSDHQVWGYFNRLQELLAVALFMPARQHTQNSYAKLFGTLNSAKAMKKLGYGKYKDLTSLFESLDNEKKMLVGSERNPIVTKHGNVQNMRLEAPMMASDQQKDGVVSKVSTSLTKITGTGKVIAPGSDRFVSSVVIKNKSQVARATDGSLQVQGSNIPPEIMQAILDKEREEQEQARNSHSPLPNYGNQPQASHYADAATNQRAQHQNSQTQRMKPPPRPVKVPPRSRPAIPAAYSQPATHSPQEDLPPQRSLPSRPTVPPRY